MTGTLVLVATPIGNLGDLSRRAVETLQSSSLILCEDTRHSGKLLSHAGISGVRLAVCNEHTETERGHDVLALLDAGATVTLITDAGTPGISDPGSRLVRVVLDGGHAVSAVPGPAAFVMALVISGFDTTRFVFEGFLPRSGRERTSRLASVAAEQRTSVIYEAPHRVERTVTDLAAACGVQRQVAVARELTKIYESVWRGTLDDAVAHLRTTSPRGEYVIVLQGAPSRGEVSDDEIRTALHVALAGRRLLDRELEGLRRVGGAGILQIGERVHEPPPLGVVGADAITLAPDSLPDVNWDEARLDFVPTLQLGRVTTNVGAIWSALSAGNTPPAAERLPAPAALLVWRQEYSPSFRTIDEEELSALDQMLSGATFGKLCLAQVECWGADEGVRRAGMFLGQWLHDGLVAGARDRVPDLDARAARA